MFSAPNPPIFELGPEFYDEVVVAKFPSATLRYRNDSAATEIGLKTLSPEEWQKHFWAFEPLPGNISKPLALRYHGHQFQHYNPDLGDGRGFLFAQFRTGSTVYDLGTKGSGTTPYSRRGDGRLTLKGAFREILATELLESYGVNTSRTFSVFETGENLERHDEPSPTRAAVLVRLNHSHVRYGTFQRLAYFQETENIKKLLHYCIYYFYPLLEKTPDTQKPEEFLRAVCKKAAQTTAAWMTAGFVHGVLNTDNMNITGESFDYGPYRFLPTYDPNFTAAYFDSQKLYCYGCQPSITAWNLHQLGLALQTAFPEINIEAIIEEFGDYFTLAVHERLLKRLNLRNPHEEPDKVVDLNSSLVHSLFDFLYQEKGLFEQTLFDLHSGYKIERLSRSPIAALYQKDSFQPLAEVLKKFLVATEDVKDHPYFKRTQVCSLLIDELEDLWRPIAEKDDWTTFAAKLQDIRSFRGAYK